MNTTMYDKLLQLPLFQGLCKSDMTKILEKVRLNFQHFEKGERIISQGETCHELYFLLDGALIAETKDEEHQYILREDLTNPMIIEPYSIYGMHTVYDSSYIAKTDVGILSIDKSYILKMLQDYPIFLLNLVNMLSNRVKTLRSKIWNTHIGKVEQKIVSFLTQRFISAEGHKEVVIRMIDMASMLHEPRINVSIALNKFERLGLMELNRMTINIPTMEDLTKYVFELKTDE